MLPVSLTKRIICSATCLCVHRVHFVTFREHTSYSRDRTLFFIGVQFGLLFTYSCVYHYSISALVTSTTHLTLQIKGDVVLCQGGDKLCNLGSDKGKGTWCLNYVLLMHDCQPGYLWIWTPVLHHGLKNIYVCIYIYKRYYFSQKDCFTR